MNKPCCPLNGLCLFGSKIRGYYYHKKGVCVQLPLTRVNNLGAIPKCDQHAGKRVD